MQPSKTKYRYYSPTSMDKALDKLWGTGMPIKTTAKEY